MSGTIDPHMHMGLYKPLGDAFRYDTPRQVIGGVTTLINYHRGKGNYFETVAKDIEEGEKNSLIDFAISFGLCAKVHLKQLEGYISELGITYFKFSLINRILRTNSTISPKKRRLPLTKPTCTIS